MNGKGEKDTVNFSQKGKPSSWLRGVLLSHGFIKVYSKSGWTADSTGVAVWTLKQATHSTTNVNASVTAREQCVRGDLFE